MQIAIVDDRAEDRAELSESCRPGQFSTCLYGHLYGEHGWNGDAKSKIGFAYSTPLPLNLEGIRGFFFLKYTS